jgi:hypothetical protein
LRDEAGVLQPCDCTLVLDPIVAREFVEKGFDTKEKR